MIFMKKIWGLCLLFFVMHASVAQSLRDTIPNDPTEFRQLMEKKLRETKSQRSITLADNFDVAWVSLDLAVQKTIIAQTQEMLDKNYRVLPYLESYFQSIANAINTEHIEMGGLREYLEVAGKTIRNDKSKVLLNFLNYSAIFFEHRAIQYHKSGKVYVRDGSYSFVYEAPTNEVLTDNTEDDAEEDNQDNWDSDYDDYNSNEDDSNWEEEDWQEDNTDNANLGVVLEAAPPPEVIGPAIRFENIDLNIVTLYDSVFITNTKGAFVINDRVFVGNQGKVNWESAGLGADSVYCDLAVYHFPVKKPRIFSEKATLTYTTRLYQPIQGVFEFKSVPHDTTGVVRYPKFTSYESTIKVKNIGNENLHYSGGFCLKGTQISSASIYGNPSTIWVTREDRRKFLTQSTLFEFNDSTVVSPNASIVAYHGRDSITHPSVRLKFDTKNEKLILLKSKGSSGSSPFTSSRFDMFIKATKLDWGMAADSLDISILSGRSVVPVYLESIDHFEEKDLQDLRGNFKFNPLSLVINYSRNHRSGFYYNELAEKHQIKDKVMLNAMVYLAEKDFIDFNKKSGLVTLRRKAVHYSASKKGNKDFDHIIVESKIDSLPNATLYLTDHSMKVRGVKKFDISKSLEVYIVPDSSEITLMNGRDFKFNGKIFSGNFEYIGKKHTFNYDSFLINMSSIDSIRFYIKDENSRGGTRSQVENTVVGGGENGSQGVLYIDKPNNKSGKEKYPNYPHFDSESESVVYFDREEMFDGAYDKSISFEVPPFKMDSLSNSDPSTIGFKGTFKTSGIIPDIDESLHVMPDKSLGFEHEVPEEGYQLYEGHGKLYGDVSLDKRGLRSSGKIDFLSTTVESDDFIYYPDSVLARGQNAEIRQEEHGGMVFPQATLKDFSMRWEPKKDSLYIKNEGDPFQFYNNTATMDGTAVISNNGVFGAGELATRGSELSSNAITFEHDRFSARNAQFEVESDDPKKPALTGDNVKLGFNLSENYADISPEVEGEAAIEFPYAKFKTSITDARWDLASQKITMTKPENVPIENSYFYTTRKDLDSLRFNATAAEYDIKTQDLRITGIPYIIVADAKITPENGEVTIHENSRLRVLKNTKIEMDTVNGYHHLYDGKVNIFSRNSFAAVATYEYVNSVYDTFAIQMENFHLEAMDSVQGKNVKGRRKARQGPIREFQTVATGAVVQDDGIIVSPKMFYKGDMKLYASQPAMELNGYVKIDFEKEEDYDTWIKYQSSAEQQKVYINFNETITENGKKLEAGLLFDESNSIYHVFISDKLNPQDEWFFKPEGFLSYDEKKQEFVIENPDKTKGESLQGKVFGYKEGTGDIRFEGEVLFLEEVKGAEIKAVALGSGNLEKKSYAMNSMMTIDFDLPSTAYDKMGENIAAVVTEFGVPEASTDPTNFLFKIAEFVGDAKAKNYEKLSEEEYVALPDLSKEFIKPLTFSNINVKWSEEERAFYSEGKLGLSNINRTDINGAMDGFLEIKKTEDGGTNVNLFFKASATSWYYFSYENNRLMVHSSNNEVNQIISSKSNASKAKVGEMVFFPGDNEETLAFIQRFRKVYFDIDDDYILDAGPEDEAIDDSDGFGGTQSESGESSEEDDDDGF